MVNFNKTFACCGDNYWIPSTGIFDRMHRRVVNRNKYQALARLLETFKTMPHLHTVGLSENCIHEKGALLVVQWLKNNDKIKVLQFEKNDIGESAAQAFEQVLMNDNTTLQAFSMSACVAQFEPVDYDSYNSRIQQYLLTSSS